MEPSKEQIRAATLAKIQRACDAIQAAQHKLGDARNELSALMFGSPAWTKAGTLEDNVHAFWYVVDGLRSNSKVTLDDTNIARLRQAITLAARSPVPASVRVAIEHTVDGFYRDVAGAPDPETDPLAAAVDRAWDELAKRQP